MRRMNKLIPVAILTMLVSVCFLTGCEKKGPAEELGETIDETTNDAKRVIEDAAD